MKELTFNELLIKINIPLEIHNILNEFYLLYKDDYLKYYELLKTKDIDYEKIKEELSDIDGLKILTIYLISSLDSYKKYLKLNINEDIFIDTFKAYSRFLNESYKIYHRYVFDRYFWTYRFNELKLFRIEELEYELLEKEITIHIPSDALIKDELVSNSLNKAKIFFKKYFDISDNYKYSLDSWLLAPPLRLILNESSNIIKLQNRFKISEVNEDDKNYLLWVFKTLDDKDLSKLKEDTSLQRGIKNLLKKNIKIGSAKGYLINN